MELYTNKETADKPWIFFGLGNVLFSEDIAFAEFYLMVYRILESRDDSLTFEKFMHERDELIKEDNLKPIQTILQRNLSEEENQAVRWELKKRIGDNWLEFNPLIPQSVPFLQRLSQRYNLGIIANTPNYIRKVFNDLNLMDYFRLLVLSDEVGSPKPSQKLYQDALAQACEKNKSEKIYALMVGDSFQEEIEPAQAVGFLTVQLMWNFEDKYKEMPLSDKEHVKIYLQHLREFSTRRREGKYSKKAADFKVNNLDQLEMILQGEEIRKKWEAVGLSLV